MRAMAPYFNSCKNASTIGFWETQDARRRSSWSRRVARVGAEDKRRTGSHTVTGAGVSQTGTHRCAYGGVARHVAPHGSEVGAALQRRWTCGIVRSTRTRSSLQAVRGATPPTPTKDRGGASRWRQRLHASWYGYSRDSGAGVQGAVPPQRRIRIVASTWLQLPDAASATPKNGSEGSGRF